MRDVTEHVYRKHRQGLFTLALSITQSAEAAEDAIQTAFERLWRRGLPPGDPVAYVYRSVRNAAIDQRRRSRTRDAVEDRARSQASIYDGAARPADTASRAETAELLRAAIERLPAEQRETIVLRIHSELKFEQIAAILDQPLGTITSRYRRGLEALRERLGRLP